MWETSAVPGRLTPTTRSTTSSSNVVWPQLFGAIGDKLHITLPIPDLAALGLDSLSPNLANAQLQLDGPPARRGHRRLPRPRRGPRARRRRIREEFASAHTRYVVMKLLAVALVAWLGSTAMAEAPRVLAVEGGFDGIAGGGFASDGALIVAGTYFKTVTLGGKKLKAAGALREDFVARIEADGKVAWLRPGGVGSTLAGIAVAPDGTFVVGGAQDYRVGKDAGPATDWRMYATVGRFSADGKQTWRREVHAKDRAWIGGLALAADGAAIVCGGYADTTEFEVGKPVGSIAGTYVPSVDAFVARLEPKDGALAWVATGGGSDDDRANAVAVMPGGDIVVTGSIGARARFGSLDLAGPPTAKATVANPERLFVVAYSATGTPKWATQVGTGDWVRAQAIVAIDDHTAIATGTDEAYQGTRDEIVVRVVDGKATSRVEPAIGASTAIANGTLLAVRTGGTDALELERHDGKGTTGAVSAKHKGDTEPIALAIASDGRVALIAEIGERRLVGDAKAPIPIHGAIAIAAKLDDFAGFTLQ